MTGRVAGGEAGWTRRAMRRIAGRGLPVLLGCCLGGLALTGCARWRPGGPADAVLSERGSMARMLFGAIDEQPVHLYTLTNRHGAGVQIATYGAMVVSLRMPDRAGAIDDVVLGYPRLEDYPTDRPPVGGLVGRYAGPIARASFSIDGESHALAANYGEHHRDGGPQGFDQVVWEARPHPSLRGPGLKLTYLSADGESGYPGRLRVELVYTLTHDHVLELDITATTDRLTVVNLAPRMRFNLAGTGAAGVADHVLTLAADRLVWTGADRIPTGELRLVEGTAFDFRSPRTMGAPVAAEGQGTAWYDHFWVADKRPGTYGLTARVDEPGSGRRLEVFSDQPGIRFSAGSVPAGLEAAARAGFCLMPQQLPDAPNQAHFPPVVLRPGEVYRSRIAYHFTTF